MKKTILTILITAIICIKGTVIASNYLASEITYNDTTVENALNELYDNQTNTITSLENQLAVFDSAECVSGTFNSSDYSSSTDTKLLDFNPKKLIIYEKDTWKGAHLWFEGWTNFFDMSWKSGSEYGSNQWSFDQYYTVNNGLYIHNWPAGFTLHYMACK